MKDVAEYVEGFDPDEHAAAWIESRGTHGVPLSVRTLIDDAEAIQAMLNELIEALEKV